MEFPWSIHAVRTCASSEQCARWRLQDPTGTHALASIKVAAASAPDSVVTPSVRIEVKPSPAAASFHRRTTCGNFPSHFISLLVHACHDQHQYCVNVNHIGPACLASVAASEPLSEQACVPMKRVQMPWGFPTVRQFFL